MQLTKVSDFNGATELWKLEGLIGSNSNRELFLSQNGSNGTNPDSANWVWVNGQTYQWRLVWDGDIASFTLFAGAIDNSSSETVQYDVVNTLINGLQLSTKVDARDPNRVSAGTTVKLTLQTFNGQAIDSALDASATSVGSTGTVIGNNLYLAISDRVTTLNATGTVTFSWSGTNPQTAAAGSRISFQLEANDLPVIPNFPPIANPDTATTTEDAAIEIPVLTNDSDPNPGDQISISAIDATGLLGTTRLEGNSIVYTPAPSFQTLASGQSVVEQFSYTVSDSNGTSNTTTVAVTIQGLNDAPEVAETIRDRTTSTGVPFLLALPPTLFSDIDQGDSLTWYVTLDTGNLLPSWLNFDATSRTLSGTPNQPDAGILALRVSATDSNGAIVQTGFLLTVQGDSSSNPNSPSNPGNLPSPTSPSPTPSLPSVIRGTAGRDRLVGTALADTILGLNGSDTLLGGAGDDRLNGGRGNDVLKGEAGRDRLIGGAGRDIFVLQAKTGFDVIEDFSNGHDRIRLRGSLRFETLIFKQQGQNVLIKTRQENLALLQNVSLNQITIADFV